MRFSFIYNLNNSYPQSVIGKTSYLFYDRFGVEFDDYKLFSKDCRQKTYGIEGNIVSLRHSVHP